MCPSLPEAYDVSKDRDGVTFIPVPPVPNAVLVTKYTSVVLKPTSSCASCIAQCSTHHIKMVFAMSYLTLYFQHLALSLIHF